MFGIKMSQIDTEIDKNLKIPVYKDFMHFFPIFDRLRRLERCKGSTGKQYVVQ